MACALLNELAQDHTAVVAGSVCQGKESAPFGLSTAATFISLVQWCLMLCC